MARNKFVKETYSDGTVYEGYCKDGKAHGKGKYTYASGDVYDGDWEDDNRHGKGKYTYANGDVYDGDWEDDNQHGKGKYTYASGPVYDGKWKDDKKHGKGIFTYNKTTPRNTPREKIREAGCYDGEFHEDDNFTKKGIFKCTYYDAGNVYEGTLNSDTPAYERCGQGKMTYADNGEVYEGEWENNKRHGNGKLLIQRRWIIDRGLAG